MTQASAAAQNRASPESCRVGAYVTALSDLAPNKDTFEATLWLWSVCPNDDLQPLETMEFVNAMEATRSYEANVGVIEVTKNMSEQALRIIA